MSQYPENLLSDTTEALRVLDQTQWFIILVVVGVLISLGVTENQKMLLCKTTEGTNAEKDERVLRLLANVLTLSASIFFFDLIQKNEPPDTATERQKCSHGLNFTAGALIVLAGLLRIWDVLFLQQYESEKIYDGPE